jgi:hypothetical protein
MKKIVLFLCLAAVVAAGVFGLFVYRKAAPSRADHGLLTLMHRDDETVSSVLLNLRLLKTARSVESLKGRIEEGEKYLLKVGDIAPQHRDLFLETFSSVVSGSMKTAKGTSPFRAFATHGSAGEALKALEAAHLVEATGGGDYVLIHPETCDRVGPLRLVQEERILAFVPAELAELVSERFAMDPALEMDSLLMAKGRVNVKPYLEELAHPFVQMIAEQAKVSEQADVMQVSLRADTQGGLWAELDVFTKHAKEFQELWVEKTGGDSPVRAVVDEAVKLKADTAGLYFTFDVNALQKHGDTLTQSFAPSKSEPLKDEDVQSITEEELLEAGDVFTYAEALTPESFFTRSEDCEAPSGLMLGDAKKLSITFEELSAHPKLPGADFLKLAAHACLPPHYVPLLGEQPLLEVAIKSPEPDRHFCGPLAREADGVSSEETFDSSNFSERHRAQNEFQFALKPGVDTQKLAAIEGSVTVHIPTRVQTHKLAFAAPYRRAELVLPGGKLTVEGTEARSDGLGFKLVGEGAHPTVLAVRALNADGKYLKTESQRSSSGSFFKLPFQDLLPESNDRSFVAYGKPAQLEVVVVEASTPLTQPFTLKPPFPAVETPEEEETEAPAPVAALDQATYEKRFLDPAYVAKLDAEFTELLENHSDDYVGNGIRTDSPFKLALRTEGIFRGNLSIYWPEDVGAGFKQMDTPLELEIQEVDFVDGTRLTAADIEEVEEVDSEKRYVWGDQFGRKAAWRTSLSLRRSNGGTNSFTLILFDDYVPARLEDVPVARVKGQLSFSLPESVAMSSPAPLSLHSRVEAGEGRFRVTSIQPDGVTLVGENTKAPGLSALFTDAAGRPVEASLSRRTDLKDGTFRLDFDTRGPASQWRMLQAQAGAQAKTYAYPFEVVAFKLKPTSKFKHARK